MNENLQVWADDSDEYVWLHIPRLLFDSLVPAIYTGCGVIFFDLSKFSHRPALSLEYGQLLHLRRQDQGPILHHSHD